MKGTPHRWAVQVKPMGLVPAVWCWEGSDERGDADSTQAKHQPAVYLGSDPYSCHLSGMLLRASQLPLSSSCALLCLPSYLPQRCAAARGRCPASRPAAHECCPGTSLLPGGWLCPENSLLPETAGENLNKEKKWDSLSKGKVRKVMKVLQSLVLKENLGNVSRFGDWAFYFLWYGVQKRGQEITWLSQYYAVSLGYTFMDFCYLKQSTGKSEVLTLFFFLKKKRQELVS